MFLQESSIDCIKRQKHKVKQNQQQQKPLTYVITFDVDKLLYCLKVIVTEMFFFSNFSFAVIGGLKKKHSFV